MLHLASVRLDSLLLAFVGFNPSGASHYSNVLVLPVLAVINDTLALDMRVQAIVGVVASGTQMAREFEVHTVENGTLRRNFFSGLTHTLGACPVDDMRVVRDDF